MRVLVTGCAGLIGWKVSAALIEAGHRVLGIDNVNDAYDVRLKNWRLRQLQASPEFVFSRLDITDRLALERWAEKNPAEAIVNLAARAGVRESLRNPWVYYETNVTGALNLLELARGRQIKKFVLASSSSLYAEGSRPFREDQLTDRPISPYAASKKAAETLCYTYHRVYGVDVSVLRYFTVYGPAGRPDMGIFRFVRWIAEGDPVILFGDGTQERDFTYVDDVAAATLFALKPLGYEIVNVGSDHPVPLNRVIAMIEAKLKKTANVEYRPRHPSDAPATQADIAKARRLLGWTPRTSFCDGLQAAVDWYRENRSWVSAVEVGP